MSAAGLQEFVTLNEKIGGVDADNHDVAPRPLADAAALRVATGRDRVERRESREAADRRRPRQRRTEY